MIEIDKALALIKQHARQLEPANVPLLDCVGRVLARDVNSRDNSPPFDKSMMDGFAFDSECFVQGQTRLTIVERVNAGRLPEKEVGVGQATQIMTGAPIPPGCDCVVMVEQTREEQSGNCEFVLINADKVESGQNILPRGTVFRNGQPILLQGHRVKPHDVAVLAEIGAAEVSVFRQPKIAVVATGDELVSCESDPGTGQIRNSNGPMLNSLIVANGCQADELGIATDDLLEIEKRIRRGLSSDILLLTGGVSAGVADLVPQVLEKLGVTQVFHKVAIKPGKPIWFGVAEQDDHRCLVFGLPGNPASSLVGFEVFVKLAIQLLQGIAGNYPCVESAILAEEFLLKGDRETFWPSAVVVSEDGLVCTPVVWRGSADILAIAKANCLARFSPQAHPHAVGQRVEIIRLCN